MESIGANLPQMQPTPLAASHVQLLRDAGKTVTHPVGAILARSGKPITSFVYVEEGDVEVVNPYTNERPLTCTLGSTEHMGEVSLLNGGAGSLTLRAVGESRIVEVQRGSWNIRAATMRRASRIQVYLKPLPAGPCERCPE